MKTISMSVLVLIPLLIMGCATKNQHLLKVDSTPADALISVHDKKEPPAGIPRKVAGTTPAEKNFDFPSESNRLWLEIEKRGYLTQRVEVTPETKSLAVNLERMKDNSGEPIKEYSFPAIKRILLVIPEFEVIKRGISSEEVSKEESAAAKNGLAKGIDAYFTGGYEVVQVGNSQEETQLLKSVWRDVKTAMELVDPIRLKYLAMPQYLETKSSREAAIQLGKSHGAEALLVISGKQNLETAGMVLGKAGLMVAGTAASYGRGYANAVSRGDSFFVYTVYIPRFSQGTLINAGLIVCATGEVLWLNKGLWPPVNLSEPELIKEIAKDLLTGLK